MLKRLTVYGLLLLFVLCLAGCSNKNTEPEGIKVVYELNGGVFQNCTLPIKQYYEFDSDSKRLIKSPEILSKTSILKSGYTLEGWYKDPNFTYKWYFEKDEVPLEGLTLYAKWDKDVKYSYNVCYYDSNNKLIILGTYEVKEGEVFDDWRGFASDRKNYTPLKYLDELKERISHIYLRRVKEDLPNIVNKTIHECFYSLTYDEQKEYNKLWDEYEAMQYEINPDKELNKDLLEGGIYRRYLSNKMVPHTIKLVEELIQQGKKVVIATCYDEELKLLQEHFNDKCVVFNGKMKAKQKENAKDFMLKLQEDVAQDVIERIYEIVTQYQGKGNRWYDNDPIMIRAVEMLRQADPKTQRIAALKLLLALERGSAIE